MRRRNYKVLVAVIFAIMFVGSIINVSFAIDPDKAGVDRDKEEVDNFNFTQFDEEKYKSAGANQATQRLMGTAINTIKIVGTGTAIVMITYMGIKYMMAAPSEKAEFKKSASIYIVGAVLVFATTNILAIIIDFVDKNIIK